MSDSVPYRVTLLTAQPVAPELGAVLGTLRRLAPEASGERRGEALLLAPVSSTPPMEVRPLGAGGADHEALHDAASQTWDWPQADQAIARAAAGLVVTSPEGAADRFVRVHALNVVLRALLEHAPVVAIHWEAAQRLIAPAAFIDSLAHGGTITDHAVNVRLFRIPDGRPGEMLMDTLGLAPFGLPDLQCHFAGADPGQMGPVLAGYADYLFAKGDVLNDDSLVRGIESYQEWACHRQESLAPPARAVVDIRPDDLWVSH